MKVCRVILTSRNKCQLVYHIIGANTICPIHIKVWRWSFTILLYLQNAMTWHLWSVCDLCHNVIMSTSAALYSHNDAKAPNQLTPSLPICCHPLQCLPCSSNIIHVCFQFSSPCGFRSCLLYYFTGFLNALFNTAYFSHLFIRWNWFSSLVTSSALLMLLQWWHLYLCIGIFQNI